VNGKEREGLEGERIGKGDGMEGSSWIFVDGAPAPRDASDANGECCGLCVVC